MMNQNENKIFFQNVFLSVRCRYICCVSCPATSALCELAHELFSHNGSRTNCRNGLHLYFSIYNSLLVGLIRLFISCYSRAPWPCVNNTKNKAKIGPFYWTIQKTGNAIYSCWNYFGMYNCVLITPDLSQPKYYAFTLGQHKGTQLNYLRLLVLIICFVWEEIL